MRARERASGSGDAPDYSGNSFPVDGSDPNAPQTSKASKLKPTVDADGSNPPLLPAHQPPAWNSVGFGRWRRRDAAASSRASSVPSSPRVVQLGSATHHIQDGDVLIDDSRVVFLNEAALHHHNQAHGHPSSPPLGSAVEEMEADYQRAVAELEAVHEAQLEEQRSSSQRESVARSARGHIASHSFGDELTARVGA
jgi:hypothetical protein